MPQPFLFVYTGAHLFDRQLNIPDISIQTFPLFASTHAHSCKNDIHRVTFAATF